jgi:hypothetical protein
MFSQYHEQAVNHYQTQGIAIDNIYMESQIWRQAFEAAVEHIAILQILNRSNYSVPERTVDRQVAMLPQFQESGRFSAALYNQLSDSARHSMWRQIQDELAKNMFYTDFYYGLLIPSREADFIADLTSSMKSFEMVSFNVDNYPDSEYLAYARQHSDLFRTIHLSRITINSSEREARRIVDSIRNGVITFEDAARAQSQDALADRGGDMGNRHVFELRAEIPNPGDRDTIFGLRRGEISDIIRVDDRWAFFRIEDELKPADFEDDMTMDRVRSYIRNFDRGRMEDWAIAQAMDFIAEAEEEGFDNAVRWWNLDKHSFGPLPINYGGVDLFPSLESFSISGFSSQDLQSLSRNENFWKVAFSTQLNSLSQPMVQGNNVLVFFPIEQIDIEDFVLANIVSAYPSWVNMIAGQSFRFYFLSEPRMDDRFWDAFFTYFMP